MIWSGDGKWGEETGGGGKMNCIKLLFLFLEGYILKLLFLFLGVYILYLYFKENIILLMISSGWQKYKC